MHSDWSNFVMHTAWSAGVPHHGWLAAWLENTLRHEQSALLFVFSKRSSNERMQDHHPLLHTDPSNSNRVASTLDKGRIMPVVRVRFKAAGPPWNTSNQERLKECKEMSAHRLARKRRWRAHDISFIAQIK